MCLYAGFFSQLFLLKKKNPLHLQVNVMYAFKKYRVFSLCGLSVCVCARVFQGSSVLKCENVYTLCQFPPDPELGFLAVFICPLVCTCEQIANLL